VEFEPRLLLPKQIPHHMKSMNFVTQEIELQMLRVLLETLSGVGTSWSRTTKSSKESSSSEKGSSPQPASQRLFAQLCLLLRSSWIIT